MTLEEVSKKFDIPVKKLKRYIEDGLITKETGNTNRDYVESDFRYLGLIETLISAGFSIKDIKEYLCLEECPKTVEKQAKLLKKYRRILLNEIHKTQKLLDCVDYLIRQKINI